MWCVSPKNAKKRQPKEVMDGVCIVWMRKGSGSEQFEWHIVCLSVGKPLGTALPDLVIKGGGWT